MKNYDNQIEKENQKNMRRDQKILQLYSLGRQDELDKYLFKLGASKLLIDDAYVYDAMAIFTTPSTNGVEQRNKLITFKNAQDLDRVTKFEIGKNINFNNCDELHIEFDGQEIVVRPLNQVIPALNEYFPELNSLQDRQGDCFNKAIDLAHTFDLTDLEAVIGYVNGYSDVTRYLHAWVEIPTKDAKGTDVIDFNMNAIVNKEGYYKLRNLTVLNRIKKNDLEQDIKKYKKIYNFMEEPGKAPYYLLFRNQIIKDLDQSINGKEER